MLLGGKYAYSVPRMCAEIINVVLHPLLRSPAFYNGHLPPPTVEAGGCLALHILANLCTASDTPYISKQFVILFLFISLFQCLHIMLV